jgi:hypothetical protein
MLNVIFETIRVYEASARMLLGRVAAKNPDALASLNSKFSEPQRNSKLQITVTLNPNPNKQGK